jgi:hypothetical protein
VSHSRRENAGPGGLPQSRGKRSDAAGRLVGGRFPRRSSPLGRALKGGRGRGRGRTFWTRQPSEVSRPASAARPRTSAPWNSPAERDQVRVQVAWATRSRARPTSKSARSRRPRPTRASSLRACETRRAERLKTAKRSRLGRASSKGVSSSRGSPARPVTSSPSSLASKSKGRRPWGPGFGEGRRKAMRPQPSLRTDHSPTRAIRVSIETMRSRSSWGRVASSSRTKPRACKASMMAAHSRADPRAMA